MRGSDILLIKMVDIILGDPGDEVGVNNFQMDIWMSFGKILFRRVRVTIDEMSLAFKMELNGSVFRN